MWGGAQARLLSSNVLANKLVLLVSSFPANPDVRRPTASIPTLGSPLAQAGLTPHVFQGLVGGLGFFLENKYEICEVQISGPGDQNLII